MSIPENLIYLIVYLLVIETIIVGFIIGGILPEIVGERLKRRERFKKQKIFYKNFASMARETNSNICWSIGPLFIEIISWLNIENNNNKGWKKSEINCKLWENGMNEKSLPDDLKKYIDSNWNKEVSKKNRVLENNPRCGLHDFIIKSNKPTLIFYPTNYKRFIATNVNLKEIIHSHPKYFDYRVFNKDGYKYLKESKLSNDLATGAIVITSDNKVILSRRTSKTYVLPNKLHASIHEGMNEEDYIKDKNGVVQTVDPINTLVRGAEEELELIIKSEDVIVLGFGIYIEYAQPFMVALIKSRKSYEEMKKNYENKTKKKGKKPNWESKIFSVDFNIKSLAPYLFGIKDLQKIKEIDRKTGKVINTDIELAELAKLSITLALIQRHGRDNVEKKLIEYQLGYL